MTFRAGRGSIATVDSERVAAMGDYKTKVEADGSVRVPAELVDEAGMRPGGAVTVRVDGREIRLIDDERAVADLQRRVAAKAGDRSLVDMLIEDRRRDASRRG